MKNMRFLFITNAFGMLLLLSYLHPEGQRFWFALDKSVFYFFNQYLVQGTVFLQIAALTNLRLFDGVSLLCMGLLYFYYFLRQSNEHKRRMICLGLAMLFVAICIKQSARFLPIEHASPSLYFENCNRLSQLSDLPAKDSSGNSFPGDHGMMLMIFSAYMARYFGRRAFGAAALMLLLFSLPRIMVGAHWFTDVYVGSLGIASISLSWLLLTPVNDFLVKKLDFFIPKKMFRSISLLQG